MTDIDNPKNYKTSGKSKAKKNEAKFKRIVKPLEKEKKGKYTKCSKKIKKSTLPKRKVQSTLPKRKVSLASDANKKTSKMKKTSKNKTMKKVKLEGSSILSTLMGELLINTLVAESNKQFKKKKIKEETIENSDIEYNSEEDSDYVPESELDDFPSDIEYTEEEQNYINKLSKHEKDDLMIREYLLQDCRKKDVPIRFKILNLEQISANNKINIIDKLDNFYNLDPGDNEYHKLSTWVDWLEKVPFDNYQNLPVTNKSNPIKIGNFLKNAKDRLDSAVYGHIEAKEKIITVLTKQISNPNGEGCCIAIQGPPGNGKTTLVKEGICKALGRPFAFIALGGMQDSSYMMGHDYTYEGAKPGRIIEILSETGCMNPVIYFDELDKISQSPKGDEIANLLCHLTDTSQNSEFHDKYMSGIDFDLSKAIFIFSYNHEENVNPILLDRLFRIKTDGFDSKSKLTIAKDYLVPRLLKDYNINKEYVSFSDDAINNLINHYTNKEKGVRNLKRCLETIISKINVLQYLIAAENKVEKPLYGEKIKKTKTSKKKQKKKNSDDVKIGISINIADKTKNLFSS